MRASRLILFLLMAVAVPNFGSAQAFQTRTPDPEITTAVADFLKSGEPVFYWGRVYYPTGPSVFFDGNVMHRSGTYAGVPLYEDATLEPHSIMYVPIGANLMRPYERRRDGDLAGTVGSRTPSFPVQLPSPPPMTITPPESSVSESAPESLIGDANVPATGLGDAQDARAAGTTGVAPPPVSHVDLTQLPRNPSRDTAGRVLGATDIARARSAAAARSASAVAAARATSGVWIEFDGRRWYADGAAVSYDPARFVPVGSYRGFPVYRDTATNANRIFVTVVPNGPIAPFTPR